MTTAEALNAKFARMKAERDAQIVGAKEQMAKLLEEKSFTCGVPLPESIRDRLRAVKDATGARSLAEVALRSIVLGISALEAETRAAIRD